MQPEILWTVADLAQATQIARSTLYEWVQEEYIPHVKVGGCVRFRPEEVKAWFNQHSKPGRLRRVPAVEV